jgi:hypothetical protein
MDYKKLYNQLILKAKSENRSRSKLVYYEQHHIIPKCLGGNNDHTNLVLLTAREHFICHWILARIHSSNNKIIHAFNAMCNLRNDRQDRYVPSSRVYKECREYINRLGISAETKNKISNSLKGHKRTIESIEKGIQTRLVKYPKKEKEVKQKVKKVLTDEHRSSISTGLKETYKTRDGYWKGKESPFKGHVMSDESKQKISNSKKGKTAHNKGISMSEETKRKMSIAKQGRTSNRKGKTLSEETKRKMSDARKKELI